MLFLFAARYYERMTAPNIEHTFNLALQHQQSGRFSDAQTIYRQILVAQPRHHGAIHQLGLLAVQQGRFPIALELFSQAVAINPDAALYHSNLGNVLTTLKRHDDAINAYRMAIKLKPDYAMAFNNLGSLLEQQGRLDEAIDALRAAIRLKPDYAEPHGNLGNALEAQGQVAAAVESYRTALKIQPNFSAAHSNLIYALHFDPDYDPQAICKEHRLWNQQHAEPLKKFIKSHTDPDLHRDDPDRRLKIAYLSPDFREHSVGYFIENLLAAHDPAAVDVFCYADLPHPDHVSRRIESSYIKPGHWRRITGQTDQQVADMICSDQIDILVDLAGHTANNRLLIFALKPAPIQVNYLGYPDSTGLSTMDYRFTDALADPPDVGEEFYTEELVRLEQTFLCYRPMDSAPAVGPLPASKTGFITFGCFNAWPKINAQHLSLWSQILHAVPGSRLLIKSRGLRDQTGRRHLMELCTSSGISPDRLELLGKVVSSAGHLELYNRVDIALDTFPYHGTTTTCEAMWMGVPMVTLVGNTHMSRVGVSLLNNMGLPELIAQNPEQYVQIAVKLAGDLPRLTELRKTLRPQMEASPLMDAKRFARNVEAAYRQMWRKWCSASSLRK
jgi:protein O-GlcNAc transferase